MSSRVGRGRRAARGLAAASLATFVATVSHVAVTGEPPALPNLALSLCLAAPICVALTGRTLSWWRLSIAVVLSQVLFHSLLALDLRGSDAPAPVSHHGVAVALSGVVASGHSSLLHGTESPGMWAAHACAAALTIVAFGLGERARRALVALLAETFRALAPVRAAHVSAASPPAPEPPLLTAGMAVLSLMRRRGPPLAA